MSQEQTPTDREAADTITNIRVLKYKLNECEEKLKRIQAACPHPHNVIDATSLVSTCPNCGLVYAPEYPAIGVD